MTNAILCFADDSPERSGSRTESDSEELLGIKRPSSKIPFWYCCAASVLHRLELRPELHVFLSVYPIPLSHKLKLNFHPSALLVLKSFRSAPHYFLLFFLRCRLSFSSYCNQFINGVLRCLVASWLSSTLMPSVLITSSVNSSLVTNSS